MQYVSLLKSIKFDRKYIGCTADLKERIIKHNKGTVASTCCYKPWELIYYEAFKSKYDAFDREKELKEFYTKKRHLISRLRRSLL